MYLIFTPEFEPSGPPEEAFWWLFKAARVLIAERISDEDQIVRTLLFAHAIDRGAVGAEPAASETEIEMPAVHTVVKTVDEIPILEEDLTYNANITVVSERREGGVRPYGILIGVSFNKKVVEPERLATFYKEKLAASRIPWGHPHSASMEHAFFGNTLYLSVSNRAHFATRFKTELMGNETPVESSIFPSPQLVETFYRALLKEYRERLTSRGRPFEAYNLIPACVAFLLRASGGIASRKDVQRLLNEHVFCEKRFREDGYADSREQQLWGDVPIAGARIAHTLPGVWGRRVWGRPFSERFSR